MFDPDAYDEEAPAGQSDAGSPNVTAAGTDQAGGQSPDAGPAASARVVTPSDLHVPMRDQPESTTWRWVGGSGIVFAAIGAAFFWVRRRGKTNVPPDGLLGEVQDQ